MKSLRIILGFLRKEFRQILRSREMLVILFALPVFQLLIMGSAVTNEVKNVRICFFDNDHSRLSRELISAFSSTDRFEIVPVKAQDTPQSVLESWKCKVAVTIPPGFGRDLGSFRKPALQVVSDGIDGNSASIAGSYVMGILQSFQEYQMRGIDPAIISRVSPPQQTPELIPRMHYNPDLKSSVNIIPGIIAILVTVTSMMLSALSLVREKEVGTLEQLMVTPVRKWELLAGKLIPYLILTFAQMLLTMLFARLIYGTQIAGSVTLLLVFSGLFLFTTLGIGILISTLVNSQQQAMFFAWFIMVVVIMLSGFFIPIHNMPASIKAITWLNPMRHYMTVVREIVIKGTPFSSLMREFAILLSMGVVCFSGSLISFRKRV